MPFAPGDKLGPYEIVALIGAGGMGEVYRARDPRLGREVAIKVSAAQFTERFEREARAVAALNHPNICTLYDVGPNYLVMELVEGESPQGPLPLEEALRIARQIQEALSEAHEKGFVHRDLKPANLKVKPDGTVKVLDFGLAKVASPPPGGISENSPTLSMAATQMGVILGTAAYMPPEQARGKVVDKRADIWAFGMVLHELITGRRLFQGEDASHTMAAVIMQEPSFDQIPFPVRRLLQSCLEKDPKKRLRDIGDVWRLLEEEPAPPAPVAASVAAPPPRRAWIPWSAAGLLAAALAVLAFYHFRETPPAPHVLRYTIAPPDGAQVHSFAVSPDGKSIVMAATVNGRRQLWLRPMDALPWYPMPSTDDARYPFWSPDSRNIAFFAEQKLRRVAAAGGPSQPICDVADGRGGSWNGQDTILFSPSGSVEATLLSVPAAGGAPVPVVKAHHRYLFPTFLPDGRTFVYSLTGANPDQNGIYLGSLDGKQNRRLLADTSGVLFAVRSAESKDGYLLFVREGNLMAQLFEPDKLQLSGDAFVVAENVSLANGNNYAPASASSNGVLLHWSGGSGGVGGGTSQMAWFDRAGKAEPVGPPSSAIMPAISPGAKFIAFSMTTGSGRDIWIRDLERGNERRLTTDSSGNGDPIWSPSGDQIVFRSGRNGTPDLFLRSSSGAGENQPLVKTSNAKTPTQWSRDGKFIVYSEAGPNGKGAIWVLPAGDPAAAKKPVLYLRSDFNQFDGQLSPDSKWMAYTSDVSGTREVYVQPFPVPDNEVRVSLAGGEQPRWRGDGKELYYQGNDGKITAVAVSVTSGPKPAFKPGAPVELFDAQSVTGSGNFYFNYDVTPDGRRFLVSTVGGSVISRASASTPPLTVRLNWQPAGK